ncbi:MAG: hypothetical protein CMJ84_17405 [Planctomycetes bacterium]|nr:hypothetical protein [Planctomycetota bacterium]
MTRDRAEMLWRPVGARRTRLLACAGRGIPMAARYGVAARTMGNTVAARPRRALRLHARMHDADLFALRFAP